jgi:hypothetical protein
MIQQKILSEKHYREKTFIFLLISSTGAVFWVGKNWMLQITELVRMYVFQRKNCQECMYSRERIAMEYNYNTVKLAYISLDWTSIFCPLCTKSVIRVMCKANKCQIYM